jgi:hypothetical protein
MKLAREVVLGLRSHRPTTAEIEQFDRGPTHPAMCEEDVVWLDVTVDDTDRVDGLKRGEDLDAEIDREIHVVDDELTIEEISESLALQTIHDEERTPVVEHARITDTANVGMCDGCHHVGLPLESRRGRRVGVVWPDRFQGDRSIEFVINGLVDNRVAATRIENPYHGISFRHVLHRLG